MTALSPRLAVLFCALVLTACAGEVKQAPPTAQTEPPPPATTAPAAPPPPATTAAPAPAPPPQAAPPPATPPPPRPSSTPTREEPPAKATPEAPKRLVVSVGQANLRDKADTKAKILQVLTKGTKLTVVSKGNQWYRVRLDNGREGWVAESVVTASPD